MTGERLYLKASGGPFMATVIAGKVRSFADMSPDDVLKLRNRYGKAIDGDDAYWDMKRDSKYATLIELKNIEPVTLGPPYKVAYMKAWYVLEEDRDPLRIARLLH